MERDKTMSTTYFVSATNGNNNNPGTQPEQALRTIQAAINKAQAGDTIYLRAGTYAERIYIQKPGAAGTPILISAYQEEKPVIDGANINFSDNMGLVVIDQSQSVTLQGLEIRNSRGRGVVVLKSSQVSIIDCQVHSCQAGGVQAYQSEAIRVERCRVYRCAWRFLAGTPSLLYTALATKGCKDVRIEQNEVFENSGIGISSWTGCEKVIIKKNTCYDNRNGQINVTSSVDVVVDGNLCYHSGRDTYLNLYNRRGPGLTKHDVSAYRTGGKWHARNIQFTNNIVVGCGTGFENIMERGKMTSTTLAHNTIINSTEQAIKLGCDGPSTNTFIENNLILSVNGGEMAKTKKTDGIVWRHNLWSTFPGQTVYNPATDVVESDAGLANPNAPVEPGALTAEPYKLLANSIAIDKGYYRNGATVEDFWGNKRVGKPDLGASEVPGRASDEVPQADLPANDVRVTDGLIALYEFKEGRGTKVNDTSRVGDALNLTIADANKVTWGTSGLLVKEPTIISSERPAKKIIDACRASNEITVEVWIQPLNNEQDGPARIVSISKDKVRRNITLGQGLYGGQPRDLFMTRLRTTWTSANGLPPVITPPGSATASLTHLVYTRNTSGRAMIYINGQERVVLDIPGQMTNWDTSMPLMLANELDGDRAWLGEYRLAAIYKRALSSAEVLHNFSIGQPGSTQVSAQFTIPEGAENGIAPHTVEFDSSESVAVAGIATYFWEFGDGQTSNRPNPTYTYTKAGVYSISLTITDTKGVSNKVTKGDLIRVSSDPFPPTPEEYARFVLLDVADASVLAFGIQYPNLRCALMWNRDPFHLLVFKDIDDVSAKYTSDKSVIVWVDPAEAT
jgi:hypothetical protein